MPDSPDLSGGLFIEPTVFCGVTPAMKVAREEIFGPVLSVFTWDDEAAMIRDVNAVGGRPHVLDLDQRPRHRIAHGLCRGGGLRVGQRGQPPFLGAPFGGVKQSGIGREECLEELLAFTQEKNIHVKFA